MLLFLLWTWSLDETVPVHQLVGAVGERIIGENLKFTMAQANHISGMQLTI